MNVRVFLIIFSVSFGYSETNIRPILRRCCSSFEFMTASGDCNSSIDKIDIYADLAEVLDVVKMNHEILDGPLMTNCSTPMMYLFPQNANPTLSFNSEGQLIVNGLVADDYCLANIEGDLLLASCADETFFDFIYILGMCSNICLPTTAIVYCCRKRTMHETLFLFFIISLLLANYALFIFGFSGKIACVIATYLYNYFFWATLFWSNVLCFNIWSLLRSQCKRDRAQKKRLLVCYILYGFGGPLVISAITGLMQFLLPIDSSFNPKIGYYDDCLLASGWETFLLLNGETICLSIVDTTLFASTVITMWRMDIDIKKYLNKRIEFHKYVKLFVGMRVPGILLGLTLLLEFTEWTQLRTFMEAISNTIIYSEGVWIFILFVVLSKPVKQKFKKFCCCIFPKKTDDGLNMIQLNEAAAANP